MPLTTDYIVTKDLNSRLIDMTLGEALEIAQPFIEKMMAKAVQEQDNIDCKGKDEYGHGLKAIQEVFGCCLSKAVDIHHDKRYAVAFSEDGRKIIVNKTLLRELSNKYKKKT